MRRLPYIHKAAETGDTARLLERLAKGDAVDKLWLQGFTPLHLASFEGHLEVVRLLVDHGAQVNLADDDLGMTALHNACINGHIECAKLLLQAGAAVNATDEGGYTPLISAAESDGDPSMLISTLVAAGATVDHQAVDGTTALHEAARSGNDLSCRLLLSLGASNRLEDEDGDTAADVARYNDDPVLARMLE